MPIPIAGNAAPDPAPNGARLRMALAVLALAGAALLFAGAMVAPANYDEDQHLAAGVLAQTMLPYRDFPYLQPPLYPFVLAALFGADGGFHVLAARTLTFALGLGSAALLWRILRRLGAGAGLAALLLAACLFSPFLALPLANSRNDALPLFLFLLGWSALLGAAGRPWWGRAAAALLFGLAVEAKLTYAFAPLVLGLHALAAPRTRLLPVLLGSALAAVPAALCAAAAPEAFLFGVVRYHLVAPLDWYGRQGLGDTLLFPSRLGLLGDWLTLGGNLSLVLLSAALALVATARHRAWKRPGPLLAGMTAGAAVLGFLPSPAWPMYYAAVPPLLAMCVAHLDRTTRTLASAGRKRVLLVVAALPLLPPLAVDLASLHRAADPSQWTGLVAHRTALAVLEALPRPGPVATLFPHSVIDANPVLPGLATGPFVFRSAARFDPALLRRLHALSPAMLDGTFDADPPAGIRTGDYPGLWPTPMDAPLAAYARRHDWLPLPSAMDGATLSVPP